VEAAGELRLEAVGAAVCRPCGNPNQDRLESIPWSPAFWAP